MYNNSELYLAVYDKRNNSLISDKINTYLIFFSTDHILDKRVLKIYLCMLI